MIITLKGVVDSGNLMLSPNTIFIAGISKSICLDKIIDKFSSYVDNTCKKDNLMVAIYPEKGYGFITFDSSSAVVKAIKDSKSKNGVVIDNHRIRIEISKKPVKVSQNNKFKRKHVYNREKKKKINMPFSHKISEYDTEDENETILLKR